MSETTPDPAVVHTGTDRVELTDAERAQRLLTGIRERDDDAAALRFINGWMTALTAERDTLRIDLRTCERLSREAADAARAELAAANTRCAELEAKWLASDQRAERNGAAADALQETLDRVTADVTKLADEMAANDCGCTGCTDCTNEFWLLPRLRAALTPEGTE